MSATQTASGACTCSAVALEGCSCLWGDLIREMVAMGYHSAPLTRATLLPVLLGRAQRLIAAARLSAIRSASLEWSGPKSAFARLLGVTPGRIRQLLADR